MATSCTLHRLTAARGLNKTQQTATLPVLPMMTAVRQLKECCYVILLLIPGFRGISRINSL